MSDHSEIAALHPGCGPPRIRPRALERTCDRVPQVRAPGRALPHAFVQLDPGPDLKPHSRMHLGADAFAQDCRDFGGGSAPFLQPCRSVPGCHIGGSHVTSPFARPSDTCSTKADTMPPRRSAGVAKKCWGKTRRTGLDKTWNKYRKILGKCPKNAHGGLLEVIFGRRTPNPPETG